MSDSHPGHRFDDSHVVAVSGKILVAAIIILFMVIVFILFVHLYAKWFWGRPGVSRTRRGFIFNSDQDPSRVQRRGLESSIIQSLPVFVFQSEKFKDGLECAVCLCEFEENEKARLLPKCNHSFHIDCIDMWFQSHSTCPLCRTGVKPDPLSESPNPNLTTIGSENSREARVLVISDGDSSPGSDSDHGENNSPGFDLCQSCVNEEGPRFPTNVLFWGTQNRVRTGFSSSGLEEGTSSSKSAGTMVIDIPRRAEGFSSPRVAEEEMGVSSPNGVNGLPLKSPTTRLRSLKRLLSRDKRVAPCSSSGADIEQGCGSVQN